MPRASLVAVHITVALVGLTPALVRAAPGSGTTADPVRIDAFPYIAAGSTSGALSNSIDVYDCDYDLDESGPEVVYAFELSAPARVTAWVEGDDGVVDIDVHLVDEVVLIESTALGCAARGNTIAEAEMEAGPHAVIVDTFDGPAQAGDYVLHVYAIGEEWFEMPVAEGITWRARRPLDLGGVPQVVNALHVDLDTPGVDLEVALPPGCTTVADAATMAEPTVMAAINSSFFAGCGSPVSFMKEGGALLATNGGAVDRGAFGLDAAGQPVVGRTAPGADWPQVVDGQGGIPLIVDNGVALQGDAAWEAEGLTSAAFIGPNPRTVLGYDGAGDLVLGTVDGRRLNAAGMSLDVLANWAVDELGGHGVVNLDGGGSTTMWVRGITPNGVVNYPSDAGMFEQPDHSGSRAVVGAVLLHAPPYNWPPRFQTEPSLGAAVGEVYAYDADAIDLNVEDVVTFAVVSGPAGLSIDAQTGDVEWTPQLDDEPMTEVILEASDGHGGVSQQLFVLAVDGAQGSGDTGVDDTGADTTDDGSSTGDPLTTTTTDGGSDTGSGPSAEDPATGGCGCRSTPRPAAWWAGLLLIGVVRRRAGRGYSMGP